MIAVAPVEIRAFAEGVFFETPFSMRKITNLNMLVAALFTTW